MRLLGKATHWDGDGLRPRPSSSLHHWLPTCNVQNKDNKQNSPTRVLTLPYSHSALRHTACADHPHTDGATHCEVAYLAAEPL